MNQRSIGSILGLAIDRIYRLLDGHSSQRQEVVGYDVLKTEKNHKFVSSLMIVNIQKRSYDDFYHNNQSCSRKRKVFSS